MTDRELLEWAAKAACNGAYWDCPESADYAAEGQGMFFNGERTPDNSKYWNPLTDDGDALRLAVKLDIYFMIVREDGHVSARVRNGVRSYYREEIGSDEMAATRRAIVRAAAEIGQRQQ